MRRGNHCPAGGFRTIEGKIKKRSCNHADIKYIPALVQNPLSERLGQRWRRNSGVIADNHRPKMLFLFEIKAKGGGYFISRVLVKFIGINASYVVLPENRGVDCVHYLSLTSMHVNQNRN